MNGAAPPARPSDSAGEPVGRGLVHVEALDETPPGLTMIGPMPGERTARDYALVLQSMGIWHLRRKTPVGWILLVRTEDHARATESFDRYEAENRDWPPKPVREAVRDDGSLVAPLVFAALVAFFVITGPVAAGSGWFGRGIAISDVVLSREPWRAVTALTLHADVVHIAGNAVSGTVFVTAVNRRLGPGLGTFLVLASGIAGNVFNAVWHHAGGHGDHASLGASTAIFGAVGILAATQVALDHPEGEPSRARRWVDVAGPIVGGFALLGALGADPHADLGAHLYGFLSGVVVAALTLLVARTRTVEAHDMSSPRRVAHTVSLGSGIRRTWIQLGFAALGLALVFGSWLLALR